MSKLALLGGRPVRRKPFPPYRTLDQRERQAVLRVLKSGVLSKFLGVFHPDFHGGEQVQQFEQEWAKRFQVPYAVTTNSATTGLYAAIGALGIGPGDEVIVSPYTMSASASCVLAYNAIPVFVDVQPDTFCLDPDKLESAITPHTRAVVVVHLFGHPASMEAILRICRRRHLALIEDCAQAVGATYCSQPVGTLGDIGVFSLNYHKIIHAGEGGVIVTRSEELATRLRLIRNHGEAVVEHLPTINIVNTLGWNFRLTEMQAAIGLAQLGKLPGLIEARVKLADYLSGRLKAFEGLHPPKVSPGCSHVFYVYPLRYEEETVGMSRNLFVQAMQAEGIPLSQGYQKPLYLLPLYQQKVVYGAQGCPFTCGLYKGQVDYRKGLCQTAERLYERELIYHALCRPPLRFADMDDILRAVEKVYDHRQELRQLQSSIPAQDGAPLA